MAREWQKSVEIRKPIAQGLSTEIRISKSGDFEIRGLRKQGISTDSGRGPDGSCRKRLSCADTEVAFAVEATANPRGVGSATAKASHRNTLWGIICLVIGTVGVTCTVAKHTADPGPGPAGEGGRRNTF